MDSRPFHLLIKLKEIYDQVYKHIINLIINYLVCSSHFILCQNAAIISLIHFILMNKCFEFHFMALNQKIFDFGFNSFICNLKINLLIIYFITINSTIHSNGLRIQIKEIYMKSVEIDIINFLIQKQD